MISFTQQPIILLRVSLVHVASIGSHLVSKGLELLGSSVAGEIGGLCGRGFGKVGSFSSVGGGKSFGKTGLEVFLEEEGECMGADESSGGDWVGHEGGDADNNMGSGDG